MSVRPYEISFNEMIAPLPSKEIASLLGCEKERLFDAMNRWL
jgi:hypothetical protein